jgi:hypothetical protein
LIRQETLLSDRMAEISFGLGDGTLSFELGRKVTKEDLYGRLRKVVTKGDEILLRGYLTSDGHPVLASRISSVGLDPEGSPVEDESILYDGQERALLASSFDEPAPLAPADVLSLVGFCVTDVYPLMGQGLPSGVYSTWFSYRKSAERKEAFIQAREDGVFLLVGHSKVCPLVGLSVPYELFDANDGGELEEDEDEMDFAMM